MADLTAIRNALAAQITQFTGLRADGQARDQVTPPIAVILPGQPYVVYGATMDETISVNLAVLVIITDAAPVEQSQRALDLYLGIGDGSQASIPDAILADTTLGKTAHFCEPVSIGSYGRVEYSGVTYFGARLNLQLGAILRPDLLVTYPLSIMHDMRDGTRGYVVFPGERSLRFSSLMSQADLVYVYPGQLGVRVVLPGRPGSVALAVLMILLRCAVAKIVRAVVGEPGWTVTYLLTWFLRVQPGVRYQDCHVLVGNDSVDADRYFQASGISAALASTR